MGSHRLFSSWLGKVALLGLVLLSGCATPTAAPTTAPTLPPTAAPLPSPTPTLAATATSLPPTLAPTATPTADLAATLQVQETADWQSGQDDARQRLDQLGLSPDEGSLVYSNPAAIALSTGSDRLYMPEIVYRENLVDFVVHTQVQWTTGEGFSGCGILFHVAEDLDNRPFYVYNIMRMQSTPHWFIWVIKNVITDWELVKLTPSNAIKAGQDEINDLTLVVQGNQVSPYINGERQRLIYNDLPMDGQIGLDAWTDQNPTTCTFTGTWIWALK